MIASVGPVQASSPPPPRPSVVKALAAAVAKELQEQLLVWEEALATREEKARIF
jgi:hypothetical protein